MRGAREMVLQDHEEILWEGRPQSRFVFFWGDLLGIPLSLFTAFMIWYGALVALPQVVPDHPILVTFRIVLSLGGFFGAYPAVHSLVILPLRLATKRYVVTDRRVIISDRFKTVELSPDQLHAAKCISALVPRSGHVQIDLTTRTESESLFSGTSREREFLAIDDAEAACAAIEKLIASVDGAGIPALVGERSADT